MTSQEQLQQKIKEIAETEYPVLRWVTNKYERVNAINLLTSALSNKELLSLAIKVQIKNATEEQYNLLVKGILPERLKVQEEKDGH